MKITVKQYILILLVSLFMFVLGYKLLQILFRDYLMLLNGE